MGWKIYPKLSREVEWVSLAALVSTIWSKQICHRETITFGLFCHRANKKSLGCIVTWSGGPKFLVQTCSGGYELVVDMDAKTCHCRKWQLSGVPCFHAVACMNSRRLNLEDGLHQCYTIEMFKKVHLAHTLALLSLCMSKTHFLNELRFILIWLNLSMGKNYGQKLLTHNPCLPV